MRDQLRGVILVLVATVAWSFAGVFTRSLSIEVETTITFRALAAGIVLVIPYFVRHRSAAFVGLLALGRAGWLATFLSVAAQAGTTAGLFLTSVAHVTVIYATCPFLTALVARVWLGEPMSKSTMAAVAFSLLGVFIVVSGTGGTSSWLGDAISLGMTLAFAVTIVLFKAHPDLKLLEVTILGTFLTFLLFLPFASFAGLDASNFVIVSVYGIVAVVLAMFVFLEGARRIPAATAGLVLTLEIVLSPFWVWILFDESITRATFIGGCVVACTVVGHLTLSLIQERHELSLERST